MTKYVLNSGGIKNASKLKREFHQELVKGLGKAPKFLLCNFAQPREDWEGKYESYCNAITEDMPKDVKPTFTLAMPADFVQQCKQADVIYFHGGDSHLLHYWMQQYNLAKIFENKVVATNSTSSDMLAQSFWTCDWRTSMDGLGILPIKFIPHYKSAFGGDDPRGPIDWQKAYDDLKNYGDTSLPIHALREGEFIIINK